MTPIQYHPTYPSLNKPLTILGVERRLFFGALIVGAASALARSYPGMLTRS